MGIYLYIYNFSIWGDLVSLTSMVVGDDPMISPGLGVRVLF
jgi:hypothetical protein